jgi:serine/threonine protein kinase
VELKSGDKLGAYEIVLLLGKGGMGEVWKAHDAQIGRDVAIKVSEVELSHDSPTLMPVETPEGQQAQNHVVFLMNFADELQRKVPGGK